jgi:hypothetical protein
VKFRKRFLCHLRIIHRVFPPAPTFRYIDVPVIDGIATLPDGRTVASMANIVRVPVLSPVTTLAPEPRQ